jgi:hypothetical protein
MRFKQCLALVASIFLVACEQVQMHGPVGGGSFTVEELRTSNQVVSGETTLSEDAALLLWPQPQWDEFLPIIKRAVLGIVQLGQYTFDDDTWYLLRADGGFDYGIDGDIVPTSVAGSVHALVRGARLSEGNITLSPLTESAYQFVKDHLDTLDDDQLQVALDELAPELVGDVDESGAVDYADVLVWNRLLHNNPGLLRAEADALEQLTQGMAEGVGDASLRSRADALFAATAPAGVAEAFFAASVNQPISQSVCRTCHNTSGIARNTRHIVTSGSTGTAIDANVAMYRNLVTALGVTGILNKASGQVSHTGGMRLTPGSADFNNFEAFLELL